MPVERDLARINKDFSALNPSNMSHQPELLLYSFHLLNDNNDFLNFFHVEANTFFKKIFAQLFARLSLPNHCRNYDLVHLIFFQCLCTCEIFCYHANSINVFKLIKVSIFDVLRPNFFLRSKDKYILALFWQQKGATVFSKRLKAV